MVVGGVLAGSAAGVVTGAAVVDVEVCCGVVAAGAVVGAGALVVGSAGTGAGVAGVETGAGVSLGAAVTGVAVAGAGVSFFSGFS